MQYVPFVEQVNIFARDDIDTFVPFFVEHFQLREALYLERAEVGKVFVQKFQDLEKLVRKLIIDIWEDKDSIFLWKRLASFKNLS